MELDSLLNIIKGDKFTSGEMQMYMKHTSIRNAEQIAI